MNAPGAVGNSDCGMFITDYQTRWPHSKTVIIHRDMPDVLKSLHRAGVDLDPAILVDMRNSLMSVQGFHVMYSAIDQHIEDIHRWLTDAPFDKEYADRMVSTNIQLDEITGSPEALSIWRN